MAAPLNYIHRSSVSLNAPSFNCEVFKLGLGWSFAGAFRNPGKTFSKRTLTDRMYHELFITASFQAGIDVVSASLSMPTAFQIWAHVCCRSLPNILNASSVFLPHISTRTKNLIIVQSSEHRHLFRQRACFVLIFYSAEFKREILSGTPFMGSIFNRRLPPFSLQLFKCHWYLLALRCGSNKSEPSQLSFISHANETPSLHCPGRKMHNSFGRWLYVYVKSLN